MLETRIPLLLLRLKTGGTKVGSLRQLCPEQWVKKWPKKEHLVRE